MIIDLVVIYVFVLFVFFVFFRGGGTPPRPQEEGKRGEVYVTATSFLT
jgi:hypothetical protein